MKYKFVLIDADDTLFDFQKTAEIVFEKTCKKVGVDYKKNYYLIYEKINQRYWDLYSVGKVSKAHLKNRRFLDFTQAVNVSADVNEMNSLYEEELSKTAILFPSSIPTLIKLKELGVKLYLITNGTASVQRGRIAVSRIERLFDGIFISDEIGYSKPSKEYFIHVTENVPNFDKSKTLIVGDSLVSDVPLGLDNGIDVCFFNPKKTKTDLCINYQISDLKKLIEIVL